MERAIKNIGKRRKESSAMDENVKDCNRVTIPKNFECLGGCRDCPLLKLKKLICKLGHISCSNIAANSKGKTITVTDQDVVMASVNQIIRTSRSVYKSDDNHPVDSEEFLPQSDKWFNEGVAAVIKFIREKYLVEKGK